MGEVYVFVHNDVVIEVLEDADNLCGQNYAIVRFCSDFGQLLVRFLEKKKWSDLYQIFGILGQIFRLSTLGG